MHRPRNGRTSRGCDGILAEWDALPKEKREVQIASHGKKEGAAFQKCLDKRASQEIEMRDAGWFMYGVKPSYCLIDGANPTKSERDTANCLARYGWKSVFRPTRSKEMLKTSDVSFLSGSAASPTREQWEFKSPTGGGMQTIYHLLEEAAGQSARVVIDLKAAEPDRHDDVKFVMKKANQAINYTYTVHGGANDGKPWRYDQLIILFRDGSPIKITRH